MNEGTSIKEFLTDKTSNDKRMEDLLNKHKELKAPYNTMEAEYIKSMSNLSLDGFKRSSFLAILMHDNLEERYAIDKDMMSCLQERVELLEADKVKLGEMHTFCKEHCINEHDLRIITSNISQTDELIEMGYKAIAVFKKEFVTTKELMNSLMVTYKSITEAGL